MMTRYLFLFIFSGLQYLCMAQDTTAKKNVKYYGKEYFLIEGTAIPESEKESPYDRLPASYKGDGIDRSRVFEGKASSRNKDLYWEYGRNNIAYNYPKGDDKSPNLAIRSGQWKFLINSDGSDQQLYNVIADPEETLNLAGQNPAVVKQLRAKLQAWWAQLPRLTTGN